MISISVDELMKWDKKSKDLTLQVKNLNLEISSLKIDNSKMKMELDERTKLQNKYTSII